MNVLVTGSGGLIGSEAVRYFDTDGNQVIGIDNNMRKLFFGPEGDVAWKLKKLQEQTNNFTNYNIDIRNKEEIDKLFTQHGFDLVIHCAAQPAHTKAEEIPILDFEVNALGTLHLLEATRCYCPDAVFIHMSTNKVYGNAPNEIPVVEMESRYEFSDSRFYEGLDERCRIDQCTHTLFGASKTAGDIMAQEYAHSFGLKVGIIRGGCLTGPSHSGVELQGFLSYLVKVAILRKTFTIHGYSGKQLRDQIHSYDVVRAFAEYAANPRPGEVYNIGGGRSNSASVLESITLVEVITGKKINYTCVDKPRKGDQICNIANTKKFRNHYPNWSVTIGLEEIVTEMVESEMSRLSKHYMC
ncbi:MAG: NAD-dependent epimerase/dehydratase family protein [Actinomycetes bacterium]